jgi:hypothetical protein
MRLQTVIRRLEEILREPSPQSAREKLKALLIQLKAQAEEEEKKKDYGKALQHLLGWYLELWEERPPESLRFMKYKEIIAKHFKELLEIYTRNGESVEDLKNDYLSFKEQTKKGDKGILHFRNALRFIKQKKEWSSEDYRRGKEEYTKLWGEDDELPI